MRRHHVICKIKGENEECLKEIQHIINKFYIMKIEKMLNETFLTQEEKKMVLEKMLVFAVEKTKRI